MLSGQLLDRCDLLFVNINGRVGQLAANITTVMVMMAQNATVMPNIS